MFEGIRIELGEISELEEGVVMVENVAHLQGRDGLIVTARSTWLITLRHGQQTSLTLYQSTADALEAAGLSG